MRLVKSIALHLVGALSSNYKKIKVLMLSFAKNSRGILDSSISDNQKYLLAVRNASKSENSFKIFRRSPDYREILEHVTRDQGDKYLVQINRLKSRFTDKQLFQAAEKMDSVGSPELFEFGDFGQVSPTSLRYVKVALELAGLVELSEASTISEIGGGYGGQACIFNMLFGVNKYSIYDLPEVCELANKFVAEVCPAMELNFYDGRNPLESKSDIVISNYAFSEVTRELQEVYLEKVLLSASHGYITWNNLAEVKFGGFSVEELLDKIPNSKVIPEVPNTGEGNCIIYW